MDELTNWTFVLRWLEDDMLTAARRLQVDSQPVAQIQAGPADVGGGATPKLQF